MADEPVHSVSQGWLTALYRWLVGTPVPSPPPGPAGDAPRDVTPTRIAHYTIEKKLGAGGMGVVYAARDERLERTVALKMMLSFGGDETARKRFWREARAAASINHPNICQIYEVGEDSGNLFIAMELLEGEALAEHLKLGPMSVDRAVQIAVETLAALSALHARGIVHRDLKPSNVFLTRHGVKLLDFGLAKPVLEPAFGSAADLTRSGIVMGTPGYMAPEQVTGEPVDARADLFAVGTILFEMLSGRPAFAGRSVVEVLNATLTEQPPALTGSPAVAAADRVIGRALAKTPAGRPRSASTMAEELGGVHAIDGHDMTALGRTLTRAVVSSTEPRMASSIVVLPFVDLSEGKDQEYFCHGITEEIINALTRIPGLRVISRTSAFAFQGKGLEVTEIGRRLRVKAALEGSVRKSGNRVRIMAQLVNAEDGYPRWSKRFDRELSDIFEIQDEIAATILNEFRISCETPRAERARST